MKKIGLLLCLIFFIGTAYAQDVQSYLDKGIEYAEAKNYSQAITYLKKANELAGGNNAACQFSIGICYDSLEEYTQAVYWFRKAAEQGDGDAQYRLGQCYSTGKGVTKDDAQAVYWCRKAAENEVGDAQGILSICYYTGKGVAKDLEQGTYWAKKAIAQENTSPQIKAFLKGVLDELNHQ